MFVASSQGQVIGMAGMRSLAPDVAEIVVWGTAYRCCGSGIGTATLQQVAMCLLPIRYDTMQCDAMRCDAMRCDAMQCNAMQCNAMQYNAMHAMQCNVIQCIAMQCNAV